MNHLFSDLTRFAAAILLLLLMLLGAVSEAQQPIAAFSYPKPEEEVRSFDDESPLWCPGTLTLALERIYKSGGGGHGIYSYQPLSESKVVTPLAVQEGRRSLDLEHRKQSQFFVSHFTWISRKIADDQTKWVYRFLYTQLPDIYLGELNILVMDNIPEQLDTKPFISIRTDNNIVTSTYADYSESNQYVAYVTGLTGQIDVYIKRLSEDIQVDETHPGLRVTENDGVDLASRWSPDGKHLAYHSVREEGGTSTSADIFMLRDVLTEDKKTLNPRSEEVRLTSSTLSETYPTWSPDSELIAFYSTELESDSIGQRQYTEMAGQRSEKRVHDLWVVKPGEPEPIKVAEQVHRQVKHGPVWFPSLRGLDGRHLIYTSGHYDKVYVLNVDEAMAKSGDAMPTLIEGLAGYQYKHITDLDCIKLNRSTVLLAYSAHNRDGQMRIYVERVKYTRRGGWRVTESIPPE